MSGFKLHFNNVNRYANKRLKALTFISISKTSVKFAKFVFNFYYVSTRTYDEGCLSIMPTFHLKEKNSRKRNWIVILKQVHSINTSP